MLIEFADEIAYLQKIREGKIQTSAGLKIPDIDKHFRLKSSNFNVILGHANVGKTSVALYLMLLYSVKHNKRWLVYSSENESYTLIKKLIEFLEKQPLNLVSNDSFKKSAKFVNEHFKFVDNTRMYTYKDLLELAEQIKKAWEYHGLFIDPYNSLRKDPEMLKSLGGHEYDYAACTEFRIFCKKNNVTIWLNTHANTEALRKKHGAIDQYAGHPIPPMASDVEGGGKFVNRADDFMVIHRYVQHESDWMICYLHIRKVKEIETGGRPTPLEKPIPLRALKNNVGYTISGNDLLQSVKHPQNAPF